MNNLLTCYELIQHDSFLCILRIDGLRRHAGRLPTSDERRFRPNGLHRMSRENRYSWAYG